MPWSIFTDGGGPGAAVTWATDLLRKIGAPVTAGNTQLVYDWEVSEGGGGAFNPLNQGPVSGQPGLTTTGSQYGGGAADFAGWAAGLQGAADYLDYSNFSAIKSDLLANNPAQARNDIIASPWASNHYHNGAGFSSSPLPGKASALPAGGGPAGGGSSPTTATTTSFLGGVGSALGVDGLTNELKTLAILVPAVIAGAGLVVLGLSRLTGARSKIEGAAKVGAEGAMLA